MNLKNTAGITLIELMIVMAIVAIIAAVAYPSYQEYMIKARRADATGAALELSQYLERYFTENGSYTQDRNGTAINIPASYLQSPGGGAPHYSINFGGANTPQAATTYDMTITPVSPVQQNDARCAILGINEQGVRCTAGGAHCSDSGDNNDVIEVNYCW